MASIFDVAEEANVSPSTVSLVVNHRQRVSPATRERVEAVIRKLGYQPPRRRGPAGTSRVAHKLAFVYTVDSMFDRSMSSYCRDVISGVQAEMGDAGSLSILRGAEHVDQDAILHQQLDAREMEGLILFGPEERNGYLERLEASGVPLVVFNRLPSHGQFSCVTLDYYGGACQATNHLIEQGHRRIASLFGDDPEKWPIKQLSLGYADAMRQHKLTPANLDRLAQAPSPSADAMPAVCRKLLEQGITAIVTGDKLARLVADQLASMNVRVPEDFSIVGFDDLSLTTRRGQSITTIGYDKRRMGRMAARVLQQLVQGKTEVKWMSHAVPTHLVKGQTSGPVPRVASNAHRAGLAALNA